MRSKPVRIGNSRGVRSPKPMLDEAGLVDEIELHIVDGEVRITAAEPATGAALLRLSESALGDWNRPEDDEAWAPLQ